MQVDRSEKATKVGINIKKIGWKKAPNEEGENYFSESFSCSKLTPLPPTSCSMVLVTQRSNVCACVSNRATKRRPKCFHDIVLLVGHRHAINDIFLVVYIFVDVLACTTRANRNKS